MRFIILLIFASSFVVSSSYGTDWRKLGKVVSPGCWMGLAGSLPTALVRGEIPKFVDAVAVDSKSAHEERDNVLYLTRNGMSVGAAPIKSLSLHEFLIAHAEKAPSDLKNLHVQLRRLGTDLALYNDIPGIRYVYMQADAIWALFQEGPFLKSVSKAGDAVFFSYFNASKPMVRIPYAAMTSILAHIDLAQGNLGMASKLSSIKGEVFALASLLQANREFGISGEVTLSPETSEVFSTASFPKYVYPSLEALMIHGRRVRITFNGSTWDLVRQFARNANLETLDLWLAEDDFANSLMAYQSDFPLVSYHSMVRQSPIWIDGFGTDVQRLSWGIASTLVDELFIRGQVDMDAMLREGFEFANKFFQRQGNTLGGGLELIDAEKINKNFARELFIARFLIPRSLEHSGTRAPDELSNLIGLRIRDSDFVLSPKNDLRSIDRRLTELFNPKVSDDFEKKRSQLAMAFAIKLWDASRAQLRARMLPSQANLQAYANFPAVFRDLLDQKAFVFTEETDLRFSGTAVSAFRK